MLPQAVGRDTRHSDNESLFDVCILGSANSGSKIPMASTPKPAMLEIDAELLARAMLATGASTEQEAVELGLALLIKLKQAREAPKDTPSS